MIKKNLAAVTGASSGIGEAPARTTTRPTPVGAG